MPFTRITRRQAFAEADVANRPRSPVQLRFLQYEKDWWAFMRRSLLRESKHRGQLDECYQQATHAFRLGTSLLHGLDSFPASTLPTELVTDVAARHAILRFIRGLIEDGNDLRFTTVTRTETALDQIRQIDCRTISELGAATISMSPNILRTPTFAGRRPTTERPNAWFHNSTAGVYALGSLAVTQKINIPVYRYWPEPGVITEESGMQPDTLQVQPYLSRDYLHIV